MSLEDGIDDQVLDFDDCANQLLEQGVDASPSELHGAVFGVLAGGGEREPDYCLAVLCQALGIELRGELAETCLQLTAASRRALAGDEFEFHLFLPDDDTEIALRVLALGDWCRGFMASYTLALAAPEPGGLAEEVADLLRDVAAIAEVGYGPDDDEQEEEAERNYFELTEYLRFATLNLFQDNEAQREGAE